MRLADGLGHPSSPSKIRFTPKVGSPTIDIFGDIQ